MDGFDGGRKRRMDGLMDRVMNSAISGKMHW